MPVNTDLARAYRSKPFGVAGVYNAAGLQSIGFQLGDTQRDQYGNTYELCLYDATETGLTKRAGMPVGWASSAGGTATRTVTGDFSASHQSFFKGLLCAVPTVASPYVWVLTKCDNILNTAVGALTLTTDGQVAIGDPLGWVDDDLVGSNHLCGGSPKKRAFHDSYDFGDAITSDSSTTLARASICGVRKSQLPDRSLVTFFVQSRRNPIDGLGAVAGDSGAALTNFATNVVGPASLKARLTGDGTANDEMTAVTFDKPFKYATGKRMCFRGKFTVTDAGTEGGVVIGLIPAVATGSVNMIVDTTGALAAASVMIGNGFYKLSADMKLHHYQSDGTTLDTNSAEDLATIVTATEIELMQRGVCGASGSLESFVNQAAAGTALTWGAASISAAVQEFFGIYIKSVASAIEVDFRDVEVAIEI